MLRKPLSTLLPVLGFVIAAAALPGVAQALSVGTYTLGSHPGGAANPPPYGLRLDGLLTGSNSEIFTFNFDDPQSNMLATYDGDDLHIFGTTFGGLDIGGTYDAVQSGLWSIDFTYDVTVDQATGLTVFTEGNGNGTITSLDFAAGRGAFDLVDKSDGSFSFSIDTGHRGFAGLSGWGWMNHAPTDGGPGGSLGTHIAASDWLFTLTPTTVPEPGALALIGLGLAGLGLRARRRPRRAA